jgi:hypothetical protein
VNTSTSNSDPASESTATEPAAISWLRATAADLAEVEVEAPIQDSASADAGTLSDLYREATRIDANVDTAANRVFAMLSAITGMHFKPKERNEPFGAMIAWAGAKRSNSSVQVGQKPQARSGFEGHVDGQMLLSETTDQDRKSGDARQGR